MNFRAVGRWIVALGFVANTISAGALGERLRETLKAEHEAGRFDGVALVTQDDKVLGEFAFGMANRQFQAAHRADEPFPVASVTKQWLAVMVLQLVEEGKIKLDDPLATRLPVIDNPWARKVTLRQLLTHTSGLPQPETVIPDFYQRADLAPNATALAKLLAVKDPEEASGFKFTYNNTDYIYLSAVLETVRGMTLSDILKTSIVRPLGMKSTGIIEGREVIAGLPDDYDLDAGPSKVKVAPHYELANFSGAGAGYSSLRDLWAFDRALMTKTLLKTKTTELMLDSSPQTGYAALGCWVYPLKFADGKTLRVVERHGAIGGYNVVNLYVPENGICVILACNISTFQDPQTWNNQGLAYQLLKQVVDGESSKPAK